MNWKSITKNRYKEVNLKGQKYKFDRWIFNALLLLGFLFLFFVAYHYNFNLDYYVCGAGPTEKCENPFYKEVTWKNIEFLQSGEYGQKPTFLFKSMWVVVLGGLILTFVINHLIYNRKIKLKKIFESDLKEEEDNEKENDDFDELEPYG